MTVYVALLGGVNVGGRSLKMAALRATAERCGFEDVATFIQSGNVIFRSRRGAKAVTAQLHDAILEDSGIDTRIATRTAAQLSKVVANNPLRDRSDDPTKLSVTFLFDGVKPTLSALAPDDVRARRGPGGRTRGVPPHTERDGQEHARPRSDEEAGPRRHHPQLALHRQARGSGRRARLRGAEVVLYDGPPAGT